MTLYRINLLQNSLMMIAQFSTILLAVLALFRWKLDCKLILILNLGIAFFSYLYPFYLLGASEYLLLAIYGLIAAFVMREKRQWKRIIYIYMLFCLLGLLLRIITVHENSPFAVKLFSECFLIPAFAFLTYAKKYNIDIDLSKSGRIKSKAIVILIIEMVTCFVFVLFLSNEETKLQHPLFLSEAIILGSFFILLNTVILYQTSQNKLLEVSVLEQKKLFSVQKNYYESIIAREEQTKRFRHDIRSHMIVIETLIQEKKYNELSSYVNTIIEEAEIKRILTDTGNNVVNAVISDLENQFNHVRIKWEGTIPSSIDITPIDLCIIFSNLLFNACEAAEKATKKEVNASIRFAGGCALIEIRNLTVENVNIPSHMLIKSSKEGIHGYGLKNVKACIENTRGNLSSILSPLMKKNQKKEASLWQKSCCRTFCVKAPVTRRYNGVRFLLQKSHAKPISFISLFIACISLLFSSWDFTPTRQ